MDIRALYRVLSIRLILLAQFQVPSERVRENKGGKRESPGLCIHMACTGYAVHYKYPQVGSKCTRY
jgi:hypothetical protein